MNSPAPRLVVLEAADPAQSAALVALLRSRGVDVRCIVVGEAPAAGADAQCLPIDGERLRADPEGVAREVERFLGAGGPPPGTDDLEREVADLGRQVRFHKQAVADRDARIQAMEGSLGWRLMEPARFLRRKARWLGTLAETAKAIASRHGGFPGLVRHVATIAAKEGFKGIGLRTGLKLKNLEAKALAEKGIYPGDRELPGGGSGEDLARRPLISVLMAVYNAPEAMLDAALWSVRRQTYSNWELCVADDASSASHVRRVLEAHAAADNRIRITWREANGNISAALNTALGMCGGEFMAVLDHDDLLAPAALYWIARTVAQNPDVDYVYSDEDKVNADGSRFFGPFFKPDWSPEYFLSLMYTCHLGAYRLALARGLGGYRPEFDGAQDYDFTLRFLLRTQKVAHVPRVLYHWRAWEHSTARSIEAKPLAEERARRAVADFLVASGERFEIGAGPQPGHHAVRFLPRGEPLVSIVIPTANGRMEIDGRREWHADAVVESIYAKSAYRRFEVVLVHNGDLREEQVAALSARANLRLVHYAAASFNLAEKINLGCEHAGGEYLVIMNDDIRVISPGWIGSLLGMAQRPGIGAVGPKLLFPDGTIQHAGVVLLSGFPGHVYYEWPGDTDGYGMGAAVARNYLAVTGACLVTPRALFREVGGFSPRYPLNYNDVDYCLRLRERGYRSVYVPEAVLCHFEGVSKAGGRSVGVDEYERFLADWAERVGDDPYYNRNLSQHAPYVF